MLYSMKTLIAVILLSFVAATATAQGRGYFAGGIAVHSTSLDGPEIDLDTWLGTLELGYKLPLTTRIELRTYIEHTSGINTTEQGHGLNKAGIKFEIEF